MNGSGYEKPSTTKSEAEASTLLVTCSSRVLRHRLYGPLVPSIPFTAAAGLSAGIPFLTGQFPRELAARFCRLQFVELEEHRVDGSSQLRCLIIAHLMQFFRCSLTIAVGHFCVTQSVSQ